MMLRSPKAVTEKEFKMSTSPQTSTQPRRKFHERFDPNQRSAPPTPEAMEQLFATAARYGYWMASPEENAAIGISL
jgi:hypothetical protein